MLSTHDWLIIIAAILAIALILLHFYRPTTVTPPAPPPPAPPPPLPPPVPPPPAPPPPPAVPRFVIIKQTVAIPADHVLAYVNAQQIQLDRDVRPFYGPATVVQLPPGPFVLAESDIPVYLLDTSDLAGALAYHYIDPAGKPYGKVFVRTCQDAGVPWEAACSHEILEIVPDPTTTRTVIGPNGRPWAYEVCDPVEAQFDPNAAIPERLSNFVYPSWFQIDGKPPYDADGVLTAPFSVAPGGYAQYQAADGQWIQIQGYLASGTNRL